MYSNGNNGNGNNHQEYGTNLDALAYDAFQGVITIVTGNPNHPRGGNRPVFNVCDPFNGVVTIQMNESFAGLMARFISEVDGVEREINALGRALNNAHRICEDDRRNFKRQRNFRPYEDNNEYIENEPINHSLVG